MKSVLEMTTEWRRDEGSERKEYGEQQGGERNETGGNNCRKVAEEEKTAKQMIVENLR